MKKNFIHAGNVLKGLRLDRKMTQRQIADGSGLHVQYVSNWERGLCMPPTHSLKRVARVLKISPEEKLLLKEAIHRDCIERANQNFKGLIIKIGAENVTPKR